MCVVAKQMWIRISEVVRRDVGVSFESIGLCWLSEKKFMTINIITSAALWALWKLRNEMCFQNRTWRDMGHLLMRVVFLVQNWIIMCPEGRKKELKMYTMQLMSSARRPEVLTNV
jgi:hypothetical protein